MDVVVELVVVGSGGFGSGERRIQPNLLGLYIPQGYSAPCNKLCRGRYLVESSSVRLKAESSDFKGERILSDSHLLPESENPY